MLKSTRFNVAYLMIAILGVFMLHEAWTASKAVSAIPYNEFQQLLRESKVKEVVISTDSIQGELKAEHNGRSRFVTTRVDADLSKELEQTECLRTNAASPHSRPSSPGSRPAPKIA